MSPAKNILMFVKKCKVGGAVASWLVRSDRAVGARAPAGDNALCAWARHYSNGASLHPGV